MLGSIGQRPPGPGHARLAGLPGRPRRPDRHAHRHRGRLRPRRRRRRWTPTAPTSASDLAALRRDLAATVRTAPARLVAGFAARRAADAGPLAVVSCDNLPDNGAATAGSSARSPALLDPGLAGWIDENVSFVTTMVDRITPATTPGRPRRRGRADRPRRRRTGGHRAVQRVGAVRRVPRPVGRDWDVAGARFVDDIVPFEERKLWLLNGGHSLLAYAGSARGHQTIAEAVTDPVCREWMHPVVDGGLRPSDPSAAGGRGLPGRAAGRGSPTRGSGTCSPRSPPTDRRSSRSASCPCSPGAGRGPAARGRAPGAGGVDQPPPRRRRPGQRCASRRDGHARRRSAARRHPARARRAGPGRRRGRRAGRGRARRRPAACRRAGRDGSRPDTGREADVRGLRGSHRQGGGRLRQRGGRRTVYDRS